MTGIHAIRPLVPPWTPLMHKRQDFIEAALAYVEKGNPPLSYVRLLLDEVEQMEKGER